MELVLEPIDEAVLRDGSAVLRISKKVAFLVQFIGEGER